MIKPAENINDIRKADLAVRFFEKHLRHVVGRSADHPFLLAPWQRCLLEKIFGTLRTNEFGEKVRQYRTCYVEIPRKNGKSTFAAGLALRLLFENEPGAEVYSAASTRDQASIVFRIAAGMIRKSPKLSQMCKVMDTTKRIVIPERQSFYQAIAAEAGPVHGLNAHGVIFDELHVQKNRDLWDALKTSMGARSQPLMFAITTAGVYDPESICWEQHDYACKVRDGILDDPSFLPLIYAADKEDDWTDPDVWAKANPALGTSITYEFLQSECDHAKEVPAQENTFRRLYLNQWTEQATRWLPMERWDACKADDIDEEDLIGRECYAGLDLSSTQDLTALVLLWRIDDHYVVKPFFWVPGRAASKRERRDRVPYLTWSKQEHIELIDGKTVDYELIRHRIGELAEKYDIAEIAIDRWNSTELQTKLDADGLEVVLFGQGFASMTAPSKELERLLIEGQLRHDGHPVLRWCASNVAARMDPAGNIKPDKEKSTERIDGIVALVMALGRAMVAEEESAGMMIL